MQSDVITVSADHIAPALDLVERTVQYIGYSAEYGARMRLLAEELIASIRFVLEETDATLWVDTTDTNMEIHLLLEGTLSDAKRDKLVEISKSRSNEPPKGLFAKIGAFFSDAFMSDAAEYIPLFTDGTESANGYYMPLSLLSNYQVPAETEKPDELKAMETNILFGMADDVTVSARASRAELTVIKKLPSKA
ncbi:MAG TPA: hypothetical protein PLP25_12470 [Candidatus Limiplasma sp.]|nr:hypothetical protein [Candidatus Limiplasma sp.]HPS82661.1 hypothetical protein [Candidatus Limiplasma sp.]